MRWRHLAPLSKSFSSRQSRRGFTIVELLIVVVVIAILAAITVVAYNGIFGQAKASAIDTTLQQLAKKIERVKIETGTYPVDKSAAGITDDGTATYQYAASNHAQFNTYYLTATNGTLTKHIASGGRPTLGPAPGHTGVPPTAPASGGSCPTNYIVVPGNSLFGTEAFCVMKYEAKNNGSGVAVSQMTGTPWVLISQTSAISTSAAACTGCHLITDNEWLTIAHNALNVASNWSGGAVGSGYVYSGHNDNGPGSSLAAAADSDGYSGTGQASGDQRRTLTLSNGQVIWDLAGNIWEWTQETTQGEGRQPGFVTDSGYVWREWINAGLNLGNFTSSHPGYGSSGGSTWSTDAGHRVGRAYVNNNDAAIRAVSRGGAWGGSHNAGILGMELTRSAGTVNDTLGFRVSR